MENAGSFLSIPESSMEVVLAELIQAEAEIWEAKGGFTEAVFNMYLKSLSLFIQSVCTDENLRNPTYISKIEKLIDKIGGYAIPHRIRFALFEYFEAVGRFGKAEDMLYELIDEKYPDIIAEGESFYLNLLQKTDRELSDGNLPRDEVVEGLEYLQKFGAADGNDNPADG